MMVTLDTAIQDFSPGTFVTWTTANSTDREQMRHDFVAMVMHDLRAPLTNLRMFLELTKAGRYKQTDPQFDVRIEQLIPELARINRLLDDVLDYDRVSAGRLPLSKAPTNAGALVDAAITAVLHNARMKNIRFVKSQEFNDASIDVDADRIVQVMVNLLQNAIKFSPVNGAVHISITKTKNAFHFSVRDEGIGIALSERANIFKRYTQCKTKEKQEGFGLGLSIAESIVKQHGGSIGVEESESGFGSKFWFDIPARTWTQESRA